MVRHYGQLWRRIKGRIEALTKRYYAALDAGEATSPAWLYQLERLAALQQQVEEEMRELVSAAEIRVRAEQYEAVQAAQRHAAAMLRASRVSRETARLATGFNWLPREAVQELTGFASSGPLRALLGGLGREASEAITRELVTGIGLGLSPREVARNCRAALGGNLSRALTISRTETLRAYREATHQSYAANADVVEGWVWYCGKDSRTCAACWAMHGTVHPITERLDDHPNGRCVQVPQTRMLPLDVESGSVLFARLTPAEQLKVLGPGKFKAWQEGKLDLQDLVTQKQDRLWGSMRHESSLRDALERAERRPRPGTFTDLRVAERWVVEHGMAGTVVYDAAEPRLPRGAQPYGSEAEQLGALNRISREWLSFERKYPGAIPHYPQPDRLFVLSSNTGMATVGGGSGALLVPPRDLFTEEIEQHRVFQQEAGLRYSAARSEQWARDGLRHELAHILTREESEATWSHLFGSYGKDWIRKNVSWYAGMMPTEFLAECVTWYTSEAYVTGTLPDDIEQAVRKLLFH
jgi:SPP1 gp7 family putative phage head morphogenesis protein